jgi:hypothetical protein
MSVRDFIQKRPWLGWGVAIVVLAFAIWNTLRGPSGGSVYSPESMREMVTIKFTDTGDEIEIPRGRLDKELRGRGSTVDPAQGLTNPKTGQPTGFPYDKRDWQGMIERINKEKSAIQAKYGQSAQPSK